MKRIVLHLGLSMACLIAWAEAAIPLNTFQTFSTPPPASDWATMTNSGASSTIVTVPALDAVVQTNVASAITSPLSATTSPDTAQIPRWNSTAQYLQSRPAANAYLTLMATIQNTSSGNLSSVVLSYDFGNPVSLPASEDPGLNGLRAYYSLTGAENSWTLIPEFTTATPGLLLTTLSLASWPAGSLLYVIWVDDNGTHGTDGSFSIDNFLVSHCRAPPIILQQPVSTNVLQGRTVRLTAGYGGGCGSGTVGAMYQWHKVGAEPIDPNSNPSAVTATLVITNAQFSDTGDYYVWVNGLAGGVASRTAHIEVLPDTQPPRFLAGHIIGPGLNGFRLTVDEPLCVDPTGLGCGSNATFPFNWEIQDPTTLMNLGVDTVTIHGTNIDFTTTSPRIPGQTYRIVVIANEGISDLFGNRAPVGTLVETVPAAIFMQGLAGYSGTQDAEVHSQAGADTPLGAAPSIRVDGDDAGIAQALIRFDNILGNGAGQLPLGAWVISATLRVNQRDPGAVINLHRMLVGWDQTAVTWNSLGDGLAADDVEVASAIEATLTSGADGDDIEIDVTPTVRRWAEGYPNNGWALISTGGNGFGFASSESPNPPLLSVEYGPVEICNLSFATQPTPSMVVTEGRSFTLFAGISGFSPTFQWTKNGIDIPGATGPSLTIPAAKGECAPGGGDAGTYRLRVNCPGDSILSGPAVVTVSADVAVPRLTKAVNLSETNLVLTFSKTLNASSAENASSYSFTPPIEITSVALSNGPANATVTLITAPRSFPTAYTLQVANVTDNTCASTPIRPNPTVISLTSVLDVMGYGSGTWRYATNTQDATLESGTPWFSPDFDDAAWLIGQAFFGFEPSAVVADALPAPKIMTPLPPNNDPANPDAFVTAYFRRSVSLPDLPADAVFALCHYTDDGAVFYLDGEEIGRWSMAAGAPIFITRATALPAGEATLQCLLFAARAGTHTLAVEVHQVGLTTSDVLFGAEIRAIHLPAPLTIQNESGANVISWTADAAWGLAASPDVTGPYTPTSGDSFGIHVIPPATQTNQAFYQLRYTGRP